VYAQFGQQPLVRTTETSLELNPLSCLSARPPDLAPGGLFTILYYIFEYEEDRLYVYLWVPTSVGSRPSATSLRGDGKGGPSEPSPEGASERGSR
jgi:hypothetical protein